MQTQREIINSLAKQAGGFTKLAELINVPAPRVSEWHSEKHAIGLPTLLLIISKLNLKFELTASY